ncbi:MAG TPA: PQQ-binding-like beta-propeller repeat protein [Vicinamibacterales bacterium]|nr:PQQ-binding-like beta-propeller repeat protein [Vicinamibacterales bacterium]
MRRLGGIATAAIAMWACTAVLGAQHGTTGGQWRSYNGDVGSTKYAPLDQVNTTNVAKLRVAWRRPAVDPALAARDPKLRIPPNFRATPLMVNGVLYAPNGIGLAEAFDPATGKTVWVQEPFAPGELDGDSTRGVAYWTDGRDERILVQRDEYLYALNAKTGKRSPGFGDQGRVNLTKGLGPMMAKYYWTGAPLVIHDVVIVGASMTDSPGSKDQPRGDVRAFDVRTGALRWQFHVIPQAGEFGVNTWENDSWKYSGQAPVWALFSADEELGYVYMPVTSPTSDMYGGHRLGDNLFGQTLVCVKADTGERVWHFQLTHHDLWDFDPPAAPVLADIRVDGRPIKAVVQVTKQGFAYVFDRVSGKPVWPIEERPVPQSTTPGERTSRTQPIPTKPPPFDRQGSTADNLIDFTPELHQEALAIVKQYVTGPLFTPPSIRGTGPNATKGTIQLPGSVGGADWQGAAFDPETGLLYVPSITTPFVADLLPGDPAKTNLRYTRGTREWIGGPRGLPLFKPPYGRITAIDLNRGEHRWMVANGDGPRNNPAIKHLNLPPLGNPGRAAPLVTKTLLFIGDGSPAMANNGPRLPPGMPPEISPGYGGKGFKALDKATGATLWSTELPAGTTGAPMTYMHNGKQYIVVATGDANHGAEWVAFGLP